MSVSTSGDMAVIVNLARLIPARRQAQPSAHRSRPLDVRCILDGSEIGRGCDRTNAGDRHQQLTLLASARFGEELLRQSGCLKTKSALGFEQGQDDLRECGAVGEKRANMRFELAAHAARNDETERLHQSPDLVRHV